MKVQLLCKTAMKCSYLILLFLLISGCKKDQATFDHEVVGLYEYSIPQGLNTIESHFFFKNNEISPVAKYIADHNLVITNESSIRLNRAKLRLESFDGDLGLLREVLVEVEPANNPIQHFEMAYTLEIDDRFQNELDLIPALTELRDILSTPRYNMDLILTFRNVSTQPMNLSLQLEWGINE